MGRDRVHEIVIYSCKTLCILGTLDNAYAYVLRSQPDNIPQHEDTYNQNAQAWHYTNARINELIQEAEYALEVRDRQMSQRSPCGPPKDSLMPQGQAIRTSLPEKGISEVSQGPWGPPNTTPQKEPRRWDGRSSPRSPLSPNKESQSEERKSVIDAVKQITGAKKETPIQGGISIGDTPEYDWDTRYDGIHGFPSCLRNIVSEPMQGLSVPFACIGSGDPVRVLHLYTTNTLDTL